MTPDRARVVLGPTGVAVAENVRRLRVDLGWSTRDMAARMVENGHPIAQSGLSKIENQTRRVDVDDLMALAVVLGVSPLTLLMPATRSPHDYVDFTGIGWQMARDVWGYALGIFDIADAPDPDNSPDLMARSFPFWVEDQIRAWARPAEPEDPEE